MGHRATTWAIEIARRVLKNRFVRFLLVGAFNAAFGYGVWAILILVGLHYTIATFFASILGILFNFKTYGRLVFHSTNNALVFRFFGSYGITYCLNVGCLRVFELLHVPMLIAGATLVLPIGIVSYLIQRKLVYIDAPQPSSPPDGTQP